MTTYFFLALEHVIRIKPLPFLSLIVSLYTARVDHGHAAQFCATFVQSCVQSCRPNSRRHTPQCSETVRVSYHACATSRLHNSVNRRPSSEASHVIALHGVCASNVMSRRRVCQRLLKFEYFTTMLLVRRPLKQVQGHGSRAQRSDNASQHEGLIVLDPRVVTQT